MEYQRNFKLLAGVFIVFLSCTNVSNGVYNDWCQDLNTKCNAWKSRGLCTSLSRRAQRMMRKLCPETCNFCEPPSPEVCYDGKQISKYGCCWDGITAATGPNGQGCPACENKKSGRFCSMRKDLCFTKRNHKFLRENCPETCGYCKKASYSCKEDSGVCENDCYDVEPQQLCERRKNKGYCTVEEWKNYLLKNCPFTCGFCGEDNQGVVARMLYTD